MLHNTDRSGKYQILVIRKSRKWKWKLEMEMETKNAPIVSSRTHECCALSLLLYSTYMTGFMSHLLVLCFVIT